MLTCSSYIIERNGGTVDSQSETDDVTVTHKGKSVVYNRLHYTIINGRIAIDNTLLMKDFGFTENQTLHYPLETFNTVEDAAAAFLLMTMPKTHDDNRERGSYIYEKNGYYYYFTDFPNGHSDVIANVIANFSSRIGRPAAFVHTHPYCICHDGASFSDPDKSLTGFPFFLKAVYLGTPLGAFMRYTPDRNITTLSQNLPVAHTEYPDGKWR